jgi:hypothetical protein
VTRQFHSADHAFDSYGIMKLANSSLGGFAKEPVEPIVAYDKPKSILYNIRGKKGKDYVLDIF